MSTMAMSSLNPDAPPFIPAAYRQVEDFSPEWWELVKTTAWFRDHWFRQHHHHQLHEPAFALPDDDDDVDLAALLPDDSVDLLLDTDDLFYAPQAATKHAGYDLDVLRAVSLGSPGAAVVGGAPSPRAQQLQRHVDRPAQHAGGVRAAARRVIHQPR